MKCSDVALSLISGLVGRQAGGEMKLSLISGLVGRQAGGEMKLSLISGLVAAATEGPLGGMRPCASRLAHTLCHLNRVYKPTPRPNPIATRRAA